MKIDKIKEILETEKMDAVFLFATKNDARYSSWLLGVEPLLYHYVVVLKTGEYKILEIDYLAESLGKNVQKYVYPVDEENLFAEAIANFSKENNLENIGIVGLAPYRHFVSLGLNITDISPLVDKLLVAKEDSDVKKISANAHKIAKLLESRYYKKMIGKTESQVAKEIKKVAEEWSDQESFPTSVLSGARLKDATAGLVTKNKINKGQPVCIDCGFYANGVHTDITRMYFDKGDKRRQIYDTLVKIHYKVIKECFEGITLGEISEKYKTLFKESFGDFLYEEGDLGHSIGFGLHEEPIFIQEENKSVKIQNGYIFTLEPEIKVGEYRYRIEDMVLCKKGKFVVLTK